MKRFTAFLLMLLLVLTLCSCGKRRVQEEPVPPDVQEHIGGEQQPVDPAPETTEPVVVPEEPIAPANPPAKPDKQEEPPEEPYYHGGSTTKDLTITEGKTVNGGTYQNVTIDESVGNGTVTLQNVTIKGKLIVQGGGSNSIKMNSCNVSTVVMDKATGTGSETPRLELTGTEVKTVEVAKPAIIEATDSNSAVKTLSAKNNVTIKGENTEITSVIVPTDAGNDVKLTVNDASVAKVEVNKPVTIETNAVAGKTPVAAVEAKANVTVTGAATNVGTITVPEEAASPVTLTVTDAKVKEVTAAKPVTITANENASKIEKVEAKADVTVASATQIDTITVPDDLEEGKVPEITVTAGSVNTVKADGKAKVSGTAADAIANVEAAAPVEVASAAVAKVTVVNVTVNVTVTVSGNGQIEVAVDTNANVEIQAENTENLSVSTTQTVTNNITVKQGEATQTVHIHKWVETGRVNATCTETGSITYICNEPGCDAENHQKTEIIPAKGHTEVVIPAVERTCTAAGSTAGKKCTVCDAVIVATGTIDALGHSFTNYVSNGDATCIADGTKTAKCDRCDATDTMADTGSKLGHSFTNYVSNGDATCTADGTKTAKCDRCDVTDTVADTGSKLGHSFTNYVSDNNATCIADGTKTAKCDRCDATDTVTDTGSKLGHSFTNYVSNGDATCTADGTKTAKCDRCDVTDTMADTGSKLGHSFTTKASTAKVSDATCTAKAVYKVQCDRCDAVSDTETVQVGEVAPNNHTGTPGEWQTDGSKHWKEYSCCHAKVDEAAHSGGTATCINKAVCSVCHANYGELNQNNHSYGEASYEWNGNKCTATRACTREGCNHKETETVTAATAVTQEKTCILDELSTYTATFTNSAFEAQTQTNVKTADKLGHQLTKTEAKDATCTAAGNNEYWTCSQCDKYFSNDQGTTEIETNSWVIKATGHSFSTDWAHDATDHWHAATCEHTTEVSGKATHSWNSGVVTTQPTCTEKGVKTFTCSVCSSTKTEDVAVVAHTASKVNGQAATCEMDGWKDYYECSVCHKYFSDLACENEILDLNGWKTAGGKIEATGHNYDTEPVWSWADDHTTATATFICARDSGHTVSVTASGTDITYEDVTHYNAEGTRTYTATVSFENQIYTDTKAETLPATPFKVGENTYATYAEALAAAHEAGLKNKSEFGINYQAYPTIEIYGSCPVEGNLHLATATSIAVKKGGSLTVSGALTLATSTMEGWMLDAGVITVEKGGSFKWGDVQYTGTDAAVFTMDDNNNIALTGCPQDAGSGIFFLLNGDVTLNADKSFATGGISNMIVQQKLTVAGTLINKNQLENRDTIDVLSGGSINVDEGRIENIGLIDIIGGSINVDEKGHIENIGLIDIIMDGKLINRGGTIDNKKTIEVYGGTLTNKTGGKIAGGSIDAFGSTVTNVGTIRIGDGCALIIENGSTLTNKAGASITGGQGSEINIGDYIYAGETATVTNTVTGIYDNEAVTVPVMKAAAVFDVSKLKDALDTYDYVVPCGTGTGTDIVNTVTLGNLTVPAGKRLILKETVNDGTNQYHNSFCLNGDVTLNGQMVTVGAPDVTVATGGKILTYGFAAFDKLTVSGHVDCEGDRMMVTKKLTINESGKLEVGGEGEFVYSGGKDGLTISGKLLATTRYMNGLDERMMKDGGNVFAQSKIEGAEPTGTLKTLVIMDNTLLYGNYTVDAIVSAGGELHLLNDSTLKYKGVYGPDEMEISAPTEWNVTEPDGDGYYTITGNFAGTVVKNAAELTTALEKGGDIYLLPFAEDYKTQVTFEENGEVSYETQYHIDTTDIDKDTNLISLGGKEPIAVFFKNGFTVATETNLKFFDLNVVAVKNSFVDGTIEAHNGIMVVQGAEGTTLTVNESGTIVVGAENEWGALAIFSDQNNKIVNNGTIIRFGDIINWDWNRETDHEPLEYVNFRDLVCDLNREFGNMPNLKRIDYEKWNDLGPEDLHWVYDYPDGDQFYNVDNPDNSDYEALDAFAMLIKSGIIPQYNEQTNPELNPWHYVTRGEVGELFNKFATKVLKSETNVNITGGGLVCRTENIPVEGEDRYTSERNQCFDALREALNSLSSVNAATEEDFLNALDTPYVTEIHVTGSFILNGCYYKDGQRVGENDKHDDDELACYLWGSGQDRNGERKIFVEPGVTLTVASGVKVDIQQGVELCLADGDDGSNGKLELKNGSGLNVFGGLQPGDWWKETGEDENRQRKYVIEEEDSYINFYPDVMDFAERLWDRIKDRSVTAATEDDIAGYQKAANEWPTGDGRAEYFALAVKYGLEPHHEGDEENLYIVWRPYDKIQYGEAMTVLGNVYKELCEDAEEVPFGLGEEWQGDWCISDHDVDLLLDAFVNALPQQEDDTTAFTVMCGDDNYQIIIGKKFTQPITITCGSSPMVDDNFGGDIEFRNCEFAGGVTVQLAAGVNYNIRLEGCTGSFNVTAEESAKGVEHTGVNFFGDLSGVKVNGLTISGINGWDDEAYNINVRFDRCGDGDNKTYIPTVEVVNRQGDKTVSISGSNYSGKLRVAGKLDISGVILSDGGRIELCNEPGEANIALGGNRITVNDDCGGEYHFTGSGEVYVPNRNGNARITVNKVYLDKPHVFGDSEPYGIFLGLTDLNGVEFEVQQGDTSLKPKAVLYTDNGVAGESDTPTKCHLEKDGENAWITEPGSIRLEVTVNGCTVVYENLHYNG